MVLDSYRNFGFVGIGLERFCSLVFSKEQAQSLVHINPNTEYFGDFAYNLHIYPQEKINLSNKISKK
jgi:hypothetical protein